MSYWQGKGEPNAMDKSKIRKLHVPVAAPPKPIASDKIPSAGPIAFLPLDVTLAKAALDYMISEISGLEGVKCQKGQQEVNEETRGIVWLDVSTQNLSMLDEILSKYKKIGWVQLPMAGINAYSDLAKKYHDRVWTSAKVRDALMQSISSFC